VPGPTLIGPCTIVTGFYTMHADPPPFDGNSTVTVPGTYSLFFAGVVVLLPSDQPGEFFSAGPGGSFTGSGPASLTFVWLPSIGPFLPPLWLFDSGDAEIHPTPEPATLLLWGTSAAGLGLARWWKRRRPREQEHAA
jgi:PEP-CTERM motif-containing protein